MKKIRSSLFLLIILLSAGCSITNILKTQADEERHYLAGDIKNGIDEEILSEQKKGLPQGYLTSPYSEEIWQKYWNDRIAILRTSGPEKLRHYSGPDGNWFADYIISERQKSGLPALK